LDFSLFYVIFIKYCLEKIYKLEIWDQA
jgi:hypothetical protein